MCFHDIFRRYSTKSSARGREPTLTSHGFDAMMALMVPEAEEAAIEELQVLLNESGARDNWKGNKGRN